MDSLEKDWFNSANCATTDPEIMFPKTGKSVLLARKICAECVVVTECLQSAINEGDTEFGFRGGMTPKERQKYVNGRL